MAFVDVFAPTLNVWRVLGYELEIIKITSLLFRFQLYIPVVLYLIKKKTYWNTQPECKSQEREEVL